MPAMKNKHFLIGLMFIVLFVDAAVVYSQENVGSNIDECFYFPKKTDGSDIVMDSYFSQKTDGRREVNMGMSVWNDSRNRRISNYLFSMNEPVLYTLSEGNVYRYTNIGSWSKIYTVRLELKHGKVVLDYNETFGNGGTIGDVLKDSHKELPKKVWDELVQKVDSCQFWTMPTFRIFKDILTFDGAEWILEGVSSKKYHFVIRDSPNEMRDENYAALCNYIESLSKE